MTAPHGPSEALMEACVDASREAWEKSLAAGETGNWARWMVEREVRVAYPLLAAEVRAAVVAECREAIKRAYFEGYDDGSDPAWCEKHLRRAGIKAEAHENAAREFFWSQSGAANPDDDDTALLPPVSAPGPTLPEVQSSRVSPPSIVTVSGAPLLESGEVAS